MVTSVPAQLIAYPRVSTCQVIVVPAVVIASVPERVNVSPAAGYSTAAMLSISPWATLIRSYKLAVEFDINYLVARAFPLEPYS